MKTRINRDANVLIMALILVATISTLIGVGALFTQTLHRNVERDHQYQQALVLADGCMEIAYASWRAICREDPEQSKTYADLSGIPAPSMALFPGTDCTLLNFEVRPVKPTVTWDAGADKWRYNELGGAKVPDYAIGESPQTRSVFYVGKVDVNVPMRTGDLVVRMRRIFEKQRENPWQYAIFFTDDCEILPGPSQIVDGWVHTNANLYTGSAALELRDRVTFVGDWTIGYHPLSTVHTAPPGAPTWPADLPPSSGESNLPLGFDPTESFDTTDANTNNDGYIELIERPDTAHTDPMQDENRRLYYQASIRVLIDAANTIRVFTADGTEATAASGVPMLQNLYNAVAASVTTNETLRDNRIGSNVRVASLDVARLRTALDGGGGGLPDLSGYDWNGVVYMADTSANPSGGTHRAVRLKNGGILPARRNPVDNRLIGLTLVSENPAYIQGDFNTGSNGGSQPLSNSTTNYDDFRDHNTVAGYELRPAAIITDAVNILSNAWTDANSTSALASRVASSTTVNAAMVSGNVPTGATDKLGETVPYSGGVENFPRFLENWSGRYLTNHGSMVQIFRSKQGDFRWGKDNVYSPPGRRWFFEKSFRTNPPPGFLYTLKYVRQRWYLE